MKNQILITNEIATAVDWILIMKKLTYENELNIK